MSSDDLNNDDDQAQEAPAETFDEGDPAFVSESKKQDNKGAFGFLLLVLVFGAAFYLFYLRNGPQSASAATAANAAASTTIDEFLHGNGSNARLMEQTLRETQKVVVEFQASSIKSQIPLELLSTNPFRMRIPSAEKQEDDSAAKAREQLIAEKARIEREAGALELQSVMRGSNSACMVNNAMYHAGEQIGGFTVVEIRPRSVVVRQGQYRFELTMKR